MNSPDLPPPTLRLQLDSDALTANWRALDKLSGSARAGAAVKANAYGLGVDKVAPVLREAGAADFFVAHWSEVPEVLRHVSPGSVAVLHGPIRSEDARFARATGVRPVINSLHQARLWIDSGGGACDLMVDTGINRLGLPLEALAEPLVAQLEVNALLSHLASADEDVAQNARQLAAFEEVSRHIPAKSRSLANSAGIALGNDYAFDLTRPGIALYGGIPRPELDGVIRQVVHPQAAVLQVRDLSAGDSVGYNATFTANEPMRVATVSLGYADGFLRCWSGRGRLRFQGSDLPLLGRVSMDMVVVDCRTAPNICEGDWLDVPFSLPEASAITGLSQYELLTTLGRRYLRE
ncbi:alanine racemase [Altererythrobacter sp. Root672]|uniref:alanine racemase n=1 Tax=Altererythrobacter sp. Root672 TaxID=1736584 RepID=UPI0006F5B335|nr:alanine racemase [Altererythrobacter sp. Root672]KRA83323.1 alanine racemase [Altererythrobacter sp. Root672]